MSAPAQSFARDEEDRIIITHSMLKAWRACRRKVFWGYLQQLVPEHIPISDPRPFGSGIHGAKEMLVKDAQDPGDVEGFLRDFFSPDRDHEHWTMWMRASALIYGYRAAWHQDHGGHEQVDLDWEPTLVEQAFQGDITHPDTGEYREGFCFAGKMDAVVRVLKEGLWGAQLVAPGLYLTEHKSAIRVDKAYREKLWCDDQLAMYSHHAADALGEPIVGQLYNVSGKTKLEHTQAETLQAFTERRKTAAELAKAGQLGRRLRLRKGEPEEAFHKRKIAKGLEEVEAMTATKEEDPDAFGKKLADVYTDIDMFTRIALELDQKVIADVRRDVWELTLQIEEAQERGFFGKNRDACWNWNRACDFWPICTSHDSPMVIEEGFRIREAHSELKDEETKGSGGF